MMINAIAVILNETNRIDTAVSAAPGATWEVVCDIDESAGEYAATIKITTTSLEDSPAMNGANVETILNVK